MKHCIFTVAVFAVVTSSSFAEEKKKEEIKICPLVVQARVWPEEIRYGDACFLIFSVTNQGGDIVAMPYGSKFLEFSSGRLFYGEKRLQSYDSDELYEQRGTIALSDSSAGFPSWPGYPVKPGETMDFHVRMVWLPLPEFAHGIRAKELLQLVDQGNDDFILHYYFPYHYAFRYTSRPHPSPRKAYYAADEIAAEGLETTGYKMFKLSSGGPETIDIPIHVLSRSQDEIDLLQEWYLELPKTFGDWTMELVFAHQDYVNGSPYKRSIFPWEQIEEHEQFPEASFVTRRIIERKVRDSLGAWSAPRREDFEKFYATMQTRTPEVVKRIKRTNELAAKIVARSKEEGSTISRNMAEFVQLRGFLVDMRYAENPEAEEAAFVKLMDFVEKSQDKKLWTHFVHEIALGSILNYKHFPSKKVQTYRERFAERFHIVGRDGW